jgi:ketosteroid isomerase-like protein
LSSFDHTATEANLVSRAAPAQIFAGAEQAARSTQRETAMSTENEIRSASQGFYAALNRMARGEAGAMADVWSHCPSVTALHPIGGRDTGWAAVGGSFDRVAGIASAGDIRLTDQHINVAGDMAYEVGIETGTLTLGGLSAGIEQRVTNIYRREPAGWRVVHHHTDVSPAMLDVLARLQAAA